jgi:hypothetical protein
LSRIVVDASITLSWCFPDEQTPLSLRVLERLQAGEQALVPSFWSLEILNSLLIGERRRKDFQGSNASIPERSGSAKSDL